MAAEVGKIYSGKVSGIIKFGAFVDIEKGVTGMVHISEVSDAFVSDINDVLKIGDEVKVKVIGINENGKIALSMKKAQESKPAAHKNYKKPASKPQPEIKEEVVYSDGYVQKTSGDASFEDMLSKFKQSSEERMSGLKKSSDRKRGSYRRR